jgi:hypothetical protein
MGLATMSWPEMGELLCLDPKTISYTRTLICPTSVCRPTMRISPSYLSAHTSRTPELTSRLHSNILISPEAVGPPCPPTANRGGAVGWGDERAMRRTSRAMAPEPTRLFDQEI